jgi:alpha-methylacyl-CoA racemase
MKGIGPGPYAGQILADLGAEVIVVERASKPNSISPPSSCDVNSRGKRSIALDLKNPMGIEALLRLVEQADVIFEGNRPGVAERLGFGPDTCLKRNPTIVYGRMTGWGQTGPLANSAGHDYNYISLTGAAAAIGTKKHPVLPLNIVGDYAGGSMFLVIGILSALLDVKTSGEGQVIDSAITDGSAHLMSMLYTFSGVGLWRNARESNLLDGGAPYYSPYETADGKHVSVGAIESKFFAQLICTLGLPKEFIEHQNNVQKWIDMRSAFENVFKTKTRDEWVEIFEGSDACVTGIIDFAEAAEHPHNKARDTYIEINGQSQPAPAPKFSRTRCEIPSAPPKEGADTKVVLADWGFDQEAIDKLEKNIVFT